MSAATPDPRINIIRDGFSMWLQQLIAERDSGVIASPVTFDADAAHAEGNRILDTHAATIVGIPVNKLFRLIAAVGRDGFNAEAYAEYVGQLDGAAWLAEVKMTTLEGEQVIVELSSERALLEDLRSAAGIVVKGLLGAALVAAIPS